MHAPARPSAVSLYGALAVHTLVSAGTYLFAKRALLEIPALPLALLRFTGASFLFSLMLLRLQPPGQRLPPRDAVPRLLLISFVSVPLNQGFFLYGLQLSTAAHAALLYTLTPLFVLLLAQALLGEAPGWRTVIGTALALGGTVFVLLQRGLDLSRGPLVGDLLLLVAVVAWAVFTAEGRPLVARFGALATISWTIVGGTLLYLPFGIASLFVPAHRAEIARASGEAWFGLGYLIVMSGVVAYLLWYWALAHLPAARVAIFNNLQPLATALLAWLFFGEHITVAFIAGAVVVIAGVLLAQWKTAPDAPEEALLESPAKS
ncbi:MAG TPA: DMT family transporter [Myxococcales bacterium]